MANLPSRNTASFDAIKPVPSVALLDDELDDMKGGTGFLNGNTTGKKLLIKTSDAADPPVDCDQIGAGLLARWKQNGTLKASISNAGNLSISNAAPEIILVDADNAKQMRIALSNTTWFFINDTLAANVFTIDTATNVMTFAQPPSNVAAFSVSWFYANLPGAVETTETKGRYIVPVGTAITITSITAVWAGGADSGASNIFTIKRRNAAGTLQADVGTVDVNTPAQNVLQSGAVSVALTAGDQIYPLFTTRNTASEELVTVSVRGTLKLT